jgi:succinate dehydrogenase / fumarate reductase, iron-sulfur subunit
MLFVLANISHLAKLPQVKIEAKKRAINIVSKMDELGFGGCTNTLACEAECPKSISITNISQLTQEYLVTRISE